MLNYYAYITSPFVLFFCSRRERNRVVITVLCGRDGFYDKPTLRRIVALPLWGCIHGNAILLFTTERVRKIEAAIDLTAYR